MSTGREVEQGNRPRGPMRSLLSGECAVRERAKFCRDKVKDFRASSVWPGALTVPHWRWRWHRHRESERDIFSRTIEL